MPLSPRSNTEQQTTHLLQSRMLKLTIFLVFLVQYNFKWLLRYTIWRNGGFSVNDLPSTVITWLQCFVFCHKYHYFREKTISQMGYLTNKCMIITRVVPYHQSINQSIKSGICKAPLKQSSYRCLLRPNLNYSRLMFLSLRWDGNMFQVWGAMIRKLCGPNTQSE